jgi:hypothetical protein
MSRALLCFGLFCSVLTWRALITRAAFHLQQLTSSHLVLVGIRVRLRMPVIPISTKSRGGLGTHQPLGIRPQRERKSTEAPIKMGFVLKHSSDNKAVNDPFNPFFILRLRPLGLLAPLPVVANVMATLDLPAGRSLMKHGPDPTSSCSSMLRNSFSYSFPLLLRTSSSCSRLSSY